MAVLRTHRNTAAFFCRIALASVFLPHGMDKLIRFEPFGWNGPETWVQQFCEMVALPWIPEAWKIAAAPWIGWIEVIAGVSCVLGLLVRFAMIPLIADIALSIVFVSGKNGFWLDHTVNNVPAPGFEYHLVLLLISLGLFFSGAGSFSLDKLIAGEDDNVDYYYDEEDYDDGEEVAPRPLRT